MWYGPDVVMFLSTIAIFYVLRKMVQRDKPIASIEDSQTILSADEEKPYSKKFKMFVKQAGIFSAMATLLLAATLRPSVPGAVYFIVFLGAATWWACHKELNK